MADDQQRDPGSRRQVVRWDDAAEAIPGLTRIAARAGLRTAAWTVGSGVRSVRNLGRVVTDPRAAQELVRGVAEDVAEASRAVSSVATAVSRGVPISQALWDAGRTLGAVITPDEGDSDEAEDERELSLRERGENLLRRSRDVWGEDERHPAYGRILEELAPDEARILLHLLQDGPQPAVDVRTGGPVGMVSSSMVSAGMNLIGPRAGLRHVDDVPAYLNNLFRLGLIWFSREQLEDPMEYQVLEAQPDVLEAMHQVRFSKVVRRSIHLTPFGVDFCRTCLVDDKPGELPVHQLPDKES